MKIQLSAPSKTFLSGEYAVLAGGPAIVVNTQPRFELEAVQVQNGTEPKIDGIPQGSPAWKWIEQRKPLLKGWQLQFKDPHEGRGGLGASSAQFLLVHSFTTLMQLGWNRSADLSVTDVWSDYQVLTGQSGSGADILAQMTGHVAIVDVMAGAHPRADVQEERWPYNDLSFAVLRTGHKVATHEHLQALVRPMLQHLVYPAGEVVDHFDVESSQEFIASIKRFAHALLEMKLQAPTTVGILGKLSQHEWCLAAKGCGAFGADTVVLFFKPDDRALALAFAEAEKLDLVATETDLSRGLEVQVDAR